MGKKYKVSIAVVAFIVIAGSVLMLRGPSERTPSKSHAVLSETTRMFEHDLQECLAYNQKLYDHDRQKIERTSTNPKSNPKEVRLQALEEWYQFEQQACRDFYEDRIKTFSESR